jgi:hypothetical protein
MFHVIGMPALALAGLLLAFGLVLFALACLVLQLLHRLYNTVPTILPVAAFLGSITTVWALTLGFMGADVWAVNNQARFALNEERASIQRLLGMAAPDVLDLPDLEAAVIGYRTAVIEEEWPSGRNRGPAPAVEAAIHAIRLAIVGAIRADLPAIFGNKLSSGFEGLQNARNLRLSVEDGSLSVVKKYLLVFLTVLAHLAIAAGHADRPPAGRLALAVFAMAATSSLFVLALLADPYAGGFGITADRLLD